MRRYDNKTLLGVQAIRSLITDSFKEFRGVYLSDSKLDEFEQFVSKDCFIIESDLVINRIIQLMETKLEQELFSTVISSYADDNCKSRSDFSPLPLTPMIQRDRSIRSFKAIE